MNERNRNIWDDLALFAVVLKIVILLLVTVALMQKNGQLIEEKKDLVDENNHLLRCIDKQSELIERMKPAFEEANKNKNKDNE